jgi:hypothetical protein
MKASKQEAGYKPVARTKLCKTCDHFRNGTCTKVQGQISPNGNCSEYYEPKGRN